jgi:hypothetical protein
VTRMFPTGLWGKVEQYIGRATTSNNFGYAIDQICRNLRGGGNNQSRDGHANQVTMQLLHDFTSNRNTWSALQF